MLGNNYGTNGGSFGSVNERASSSEPPRTVIDTSQPTCSFRYLFSFNGILKLLAVSSTLMALVFVLARTTLSESYTEGTSHFTLFASATGAVYSGILLLLCICHFSPWAALEAIFSGLHTVTLGIAGGLMIPYFQKDWRPLIRMGVASSSDPAHPAAASTGIHCSPLYLRTVPGILKIFEIILSVIAFILAYSGYFWSDYSLGSAGWTKFATGTAFVSSALFLIYYLLGLSPWLLYEMIFDFVMAIFLLIAGAVMIPYSDRDNTRAACVAFCWAAMVCYAVDGLLKVRLRRRDTVTSSGVLTHQVVKV
ncbi:hypothetical protein BV898_03272 [Hypsibius exemplaris]|uniref:MARVEL domain-containing protein n=1 Tax=Hypsibius exemplaris TaxID=2072580 RepID=A0A1W0X5R2_HYPEX|nr:hypothetical protein BV898_03272 [Hypsibius exemplaris]